MLARSKWYLGGFILPDMPIVREDHLGDKSWMAINFKSFFHLRWWYCSRKSSYWGDQSHYVAWSRAERYVGRHFVAGRECQRARYIDGGEHSMLEGSNWEGDQKARENDEAEDWEAINIRRSEDWETADDFKGEKMGCGGELGCGIFLRNTRRCCRSEESVELMVVSPNSCLQLMNWWKWGVFSLRWLERKLAQPCIAEVRDFVNKHWMKKADALGLWPAWKWKPSIIGCTVILQCYISLLVDRDIL